ncbi:MAG: FAD-dependent oxidoreductase, partial [Natronosporangium sp.]
MAAGQPAERTADVVVVGAGPAALLLTELLARAGNQVVIVERQADPTQVTQSVMLQPSTLGILRRLGLPRLAAPEVGRIAGLEEYGPDGQLFSGRYASLPDPPATYGQIVSLGELRRILLAQVRRSPNVTVLTSTTVHRLLRHEIGDCRMETVAAGGSGGPTRLVSSWVVAADGKHSAVRQLAMIDAAVPGFAHSMFLTPIPTPPG